jgi:sensor c-di-GMP phosphodiesterase-like protein
MLTGLERGEFFLEYLPIVDLAEGRCTGAEALVRWRRATGVVQPADFIPLAQNTIVSGLLTYWVFDTVMAEMGDWLRTNPNACLAVNVPPEILGRAGMLYAAKKCGLIEFASQIVLELTERGVPDLLGLDAWNFAKKMGVRTALDDLTLLGGTNLAILGRAHFDIIKLDRSLVAEISPECSDPNWLAGITALVRSSQLQVIAEGVETQQQVMKLREAGIQEAQGFYFSPPIPAALFIDYYREARHSLPNQPLQQPGGV